jgi:hypothetical protein
MRKGRFNVKEKQKGVNREPPELQQGIICCVAFDRSSLRSIVATASVAAPRRLVSNTLLKIRNTKRMTQNFRHFSWGLQSPGAVDIF